MVTTARRKAYKRLIVCTGKGNGSASTLTFAVNGKSMGSYL